MTPGGSAVTAAIATSNADADKANRAGATRVKGAKAKIKTQQAAAKASHTAAVNELAAKVEEAKTEAASATQKANREQAEKTNQKASCEEAGKGKPQNVKETARIRTPHPTTKWDTGVHSPEMKGRQNHRTSVAYAKSPVCAGKMRLLSANSAEKTIQTPHFWVFL